MGSSNPVEEITEAVTNVATNVATFGILGYEDGKIRTGATTQMVDEGLGEITGRNQQREALALGEDRLRREEARRDQMMAEQRMAEMNADIMASQNAGRGRRGTVRGGGGSLGDVNMASGDFLGL